MLLFATVLYHISQSIPQEKRQLLKHILDSNGAQSAGSVKVAAFVITNSHRFEGWQDLKEGAFAVTDKWVERSLVLGKVQSPQCYSPDPAMIFSGVVACATELPPQDLEVLSAGITALGGQWRTGLTKEVTHLFAINTTSPKYETAFHFQEETGVKVVLPHWFDDAVRLGMGYLSVTPYEWPDPPLLRNEALLDDQVNGKAKGKGKKVATIEQDAVKRTLYATATKYTLLGSSPTVSFDRADEGAAGSSYTDVWEGRKILLGRTLKLFGGRREAVEVGIQRAGGVIVRWEGDEDDDADSAILDASDLKRQESERQKKEADASEGCDIYITRWRGGRAYVRSFRSNKTIGTLPWLYHVQSTGIFTRPLDQLLHFPIPKKPIEGFGGHEITITNYTGEAREYLKKLITTMGATFTPSMSGRNTALIAANTDGVKADRAKAWSIPVVNHTWLEDCFVQWRNLTVGHEKYITFPHSLEFSQLLGERGVGIGKMLEDEVEAMDDDDESGSEEGLNGPSHSPEKHVLSNGLGSAAQGEGMETEPPPGTEQSMREVAGLVDNDGDAVMNASGDYAIGMDLDVPSDDESLQADDDADQHLEEEEVVKPQKSPTKSDNSRSKKDAKVKQLPSKPLTPSTSPSKTSTKAPFKSATKATEPKSSSKLRRKAPPEEEDDDDDDDPLRIRRRSNHRPRESDTEEDEEPVIPAPSKFKKAKRVVTPPDDEDDESNAEILKPTKSKKQVGKRTRPHAVEDEVVEEEEEEEEEEQAEVVVVSVKKGGKKASGEVGKLKMVRGDARTTVKKKAQEKHVESEDESEESESDTPVISNGKGKGKATSKVKPKPKVISSSKATSSKTKLPINSSDDDQGRGDSPPSRSKKAAKVEADDDALSDSSLPSLILSSRPKPRPKTRVSHVDASDSDVEMVPQSPKRIVSVLMPSLELSGKGKKGAQNRSSKSAPTRGRVIQDDDDNDVEEGSDTQLPAVSKQSPRTRSIKKAGSIHIAAGEKGQSPTKPKNSKVPKSGKHPTSDVASTSKKVTIPASVISIDDTSDHSNSVISAPPPRRSAAAKATARLRDEIMPDLVNFEQQMRKSRRSGGGVSGFIVDGDTPVESVAKRKKSMGKSVEREESVEEEEEEMGDKKRRKVEAAAQPKKNGKQKAVTTEGDDDAQQSVAKGQKGRRASKKSADEEDREDEEETVTVVSTSKGSTKKKREQETQQRPPIWMMTTQVTLSDDVMKNLAKLGVQVTTRTSECTHLVANKLVRTEKFLCALAVAPYVLSADWAIKSSQAKKLLPEEDYLLEDTAGEKKYGVNLAKSLKRAKQSEGKLLVNKTFYITPRVAVDVKLLRNVVAACGGQVSTQTPTARILNISADRHIVSCPEDISIWRPLLRSGHSIYTQELLLAGTLNQKMDWDNDSFKVEGSV